MNYYDAYGLPGVVTRMFNNSWPATKSSIYHWHYHHAGIGATNYRTRSLGPDARFLLLLGRDPGHLTVAAWGRSGDVYCYGQGKNVSMADWAATIIDIGHNHGYWGEREIVSVTDRLRPGSSDVMALRVGYDKLYDETGWKPAVSWEEGILRTIEWYATRREQWIGPVSTGPRRIPGYRAWFSAFAPR